MDTKCVILINEFRVLEDEADAPTEASGENLGQSPTRSSFSLTAEAGRDAVSGPLSPANSTRSRQQWQAALYKKKGRTTPRNGTVGSCQGQSPLTNPYNRQSQRVPNDDTRQGDTPCMVAVRIQPDCQSYKTRFLFVLDVQQSPHGRIAIDALLRTSVVSPDHRAGIRRGLSGLHRVLADPVPHPGRRRRLRRDL